MAKTLQWTCDGEIPITVLINTLKYIETYYKLCIEIYYRHIEIHHKYTIIHSNAFKYNMHTFKYTTNIL
jgi:hypothetical protein